MLVTPTLMVNSLSLTSTLVLVLSELGKISRTHRIHSLTRLVWPTSTGRKLSHSHPLVMRKSTMLLSRVNQFTKNNSVMENWSRYVSTVSVSTVVSWPPTLKDSITGKTSHGTSWPGSLPTYPTQTSKKGIDNSLSSKVVYFTTSSGRTKKTPALSLMLISKGTSKECGHSSTTRTA